MCIVGTLEADDTKNKIEAHSMVGVYKSCFAEECKRSFADDIS